MSHFSDEFVGIVAAGVSAFMAAKAHSAAEKGSPLGKAIEEAAQRMPNKFGIGRADEQMFEALRQLLKPSDRRLVDTVIGKMQPHESAIFRLTITGMPCGGETVKKPAKNPQKGQPATVEERISWEFTPNDLRVKYLQDIADEVAALVTSGLAEDAAADRVVDGMRSRRLITRSPAAQAAYELWVDASAWAEANILEFFGVQDFDELTHAHIERRLESVLENLERGHPSTIRLRRIYEPQGGVLRPTGVRLQTKVPGLGRIFLEEVWGLFAPAVSAFSSLLHAIRPRWPSWPKSQPFRRRPRGRPTAKPVDIDHRIGRK